MFSRFLFFFQVRALRVVEYHLYNPGWPATPRASGGGLLPPGLLLRSGTGRRRLAGGRSSGWPWRGCSTTARCSPSSTSARPPSATPAGAPEASAPAPVSVSCCGLGRYGEVGWVQAREAPSELPPQAPNLRGGKKPQRDSKHLSLFIFVCSLMYLFFRSVCHLLLCIMIQIYMLKKIDLHSAVPHVSYPPPASLVPLALCLYLARPHGEGRTRCRCVSVRC